VTTRRCHEPASEELANFIRNGATTYFHSSGACRMGKDDKAVVDSQLRVNGVHNLRIADSTIMPRIVAVPTMPACVLIGLRLAEMLVGRSRFMREREQ
jgi:choline dehydrogenase